MQKKCYEPCLYVNSIVYRSLIIESKCEIIPFIFMKITFLILRSSKYDILLLSVVFFLMTVISQVNYFMPKG